MLACTTVASSWRGTEHPLTKAHGQGWKSGLSRRSPCAPLRDHIGCCSQFASFWLPGATPDPCEPSLPTPATASWESAISLFPSGGFVSTASVQELRFIGSLGWWEGCNTKVDTRWHQREAFAPNPRHSPAHLWVGVVLSPFIKVGEKEWVWDLRGLQGEGIHLLLLAPP